MMCYECCLLQHWGAAKLEPRLTGPVRQGRLERPVRNPIRNNHETKDDDEPKGSSDWLTCPAYWQLWCHRSLVLTL